MKKRLETQRKPMKVPGYQVSRGCCYEADAASGTRAEAEPKKTKT
jgi:hypothetical protein